MSASSTESLSGPESDITLIQNLAQARHAPTDAGFHRAERERYGPRNLTVAQASKERQGDELTLKQLDLGRHLFFKPYLYVFNRATSLDKAMGLFAVSLPLIASLVAIFLAIYWALKHYAGIDLFRIVSDVYAFKDFVGDAAPAIYALVISFVLSKAADLVIRGSGKWASRIQKLMKGPMALISGFFVRALLPVVFSIPIIIYVYTIDRYFIRRMGRLD